MQLQYEIAFCNLLPVITIPSPCQGTIKKNMAISTIKIFHRQNRSCIISLLLTQYKLGMNYILTFLKGLAMGAADVVPGVSGGTIAFITGIYDRLLESIRRVNPSLIRFWRQQGFKAVLVHINAGFLISLFLGIITSILTLAKVISWLLVTHPIPIWSFFFGLILVSVLHIYKQVQKQDFFRFFCLILGIALAYFITVLSPLELEPTHLNVALAGAIAICAMILPGISGSTARLLPTGTQPRLTSTVLSESATRNGVSTW